ncbi:hypothetical protein C6Q07_11120 [Burkholderia multivorans]|nr:hypothetical protein C6Q07_11120 [Burkholderia multivorans]
MEGIPMDVSLQCPRCLSDEFDQPFDDDTDRNLPMTCSRCGFVSFAGDLYDAAIQRGVDLLTKDLCRRLREGGEDG